MAIQCNKYKIRANGKIYVPGDVIEGLSKKEEARLVSEGYAEYVKVIKEQLPSETGDPPNDPPPGTPPIDPPNDPEGEPEDGPETGYPEDENKKAKTSSTKK